MRRPLLLAVPAFLAAAPGWALTPEELWSAWQAQAAGFGVTLTAEAVPGPDGALTLRGFARSLDGGPMEPMPAESPVQEVVLRPLADGAVEIDLGLPDRGTIPGGADEMGDLYLEEDGFSFLARDGADAIEYELTADSIRLASLPPAGGPDLDNVAAEVWGLSLRLPGDFGPDRTAEASVSLDGFAYVVNLSDPDFGMASSQSGRSEGRLAMSGSLTLPEGVTLETFDQMDPAEALARGFAARLDFESDAGTTQSSFEGFPFSYSYSAAMEPGRGSFAVDGSLVSLTASYGGGTVSFSSPALPLPSIEATYGPLSAEVTVPLGPEPSDFRYLVSFESLTLDDATWAALDPQNLLPREPLAFALELGGTVGLDLAAIMAADASGAEAAPPTVESLELRRLELSAAGVRASASGTLAFDNATGEPMPSAGSGTARVEGLDRLIDALVSLGWITAEDARNARLGLAAAFRPGDAPDTRQATVELRPDGTVWANGVQLQ